MEKRIEKLNKYLMGWCGYFALAETPSKFKEFDEWIRRRLRMCLWKEWKTPKTRIRKLRGLGVPSHKHSNGEIHARNIGGLPAVPFYTKPSTPPIGRVEG